MPIGVGEAAAVVRLTFEAFLQLTGFAKGRLRSRAIEHELDRAWRELLKGDAADMAVVEAALENARAAGPLSPSAARLAATKARIDAPARKPASRRRARDASAKPAALARRGRRSAKD